MTSTITKIGANDGRFSFIAAENGFDVIATDSDEQCINALYTKTKKQQTTNILPLCVDIAAPTPALGFANLERSSFDKRIQADLVLALALIHHLVIGRNIPLPFLAEYLSQLAPQLIIEFVPKEDAKTQLLLRNKKDLYPDYTITKFEEIFQAYFKIIRKEQLITSKRCIYLLERLG